MDISRSVPCLSRTDFFKSSFSTGSCTCVETKITEDQVLVRDSKLQLLPGYDPMTEPIVRASMGAWYVFLQEVTGELSAGANGELLASSNPDGSVDLIAQDCELHFNLDEWTAFVLGVRAGEFTPILTLA